MNEWLLRLTIALVPSLATWLVTRWRWRVDVRKDADKAQADALGAVKKELMDAIKAQSAALATTAAKLEADLKAHTTAQGDTIKARLDGTDARLTSIDNRLTSIEHDLRRGTLAYGFARDQEAEAPAAATG